MKPSLCSLTSLAFYSLLTSAQAQQYTLSDYYNPSSFTSQFIFFTGDDPTHGYVNYISESAASAAGIFSTTSSSIRLGVDSTNIPSASARGRDSVRVESTKTYNAGTLIILDATHMPVGCGTWPAFWLYGPNWPTNGEVDIIEGVNTQGRTRLLRTRMLGARSRIARSSFWATNAGCGVVSSQGGASYGAGFNANGGGVYATQWTDEAISIWFFPRGNVPGDISSGSPNPSSWGLPQARFGGSGCDIGQHFRDQKIVINTALCGDWAGNVWSQDATCSAKAATCSDFVRDNPGAFADAYWEISSLKVYQSNGNASPSSTAVQLPSTLSTVTTVATSSSAAATTADTTIMAPTTTPDTTTLPPSTFATSTITVPATSFSTSTITVEESTPAVVPPTPSAPGETAPPMTSAWADSTPSDAPSWTGGYRGGGGGRWGGAGGGGGGGRWGPPPVTRTLLGPDRMNTYEFPLL
ncbi:uncharacterized protein AB675_6115 [Cyphellophora attinorum]|uniref:GH16 domain-containing protein n=1 Tax=Cyphellophora attinorum TaxID=1664694 RepID=A0A0N1H8Z3_9EURO|nr:uncharacterized protein AB675_6115 [Phialophora attinorum]KPI43777.1 hypothetical protein AB675_6115 [Phialophora attinorum]